MATNTEDFITIANIIKHEIHRRKKQKKPKDPATMNTPYNSKILKKKGKKKTIKVVTSKEIKPLKNLNKQELTDKEYSKNDSHQSVDMDVETYDSNNYIGEDGGTKLEFFYSQNDHIVKFKDNSKNVEEDNMSLFKKKKKKKKGHKKILQNYENLKNDITTLEVEKLYIETCNDSDKHSNKVKTRDSYLNKDESTRRIPIANASEGDPLLKSPLKNTKKKKKKSKKYQTIKEDTESSKYEPIQINHINIEDLKKDIPEVQSDKIHNDPATMNTPYNSKILKKKGKKKTIKVVTSKEIKPLKNLNKQELTDKEYSKNDSHQSVDMDVETYDSNNYIGEDGGTKLEFFYSQNDHIVKFKDNSKNVEEDNMSLFKKKKKKKKGHKKILQNYENLKNDITTLEVEKLYIETCNDSDKHSNKVKTRDSYLNKDESTRRIPIANASEGDPLLKSPLKNTKKKKKKSKKYQTIKEDTESSKYEPIQINHINIEDLKKDIPEVQSDKIHNDPATMNTPYNSKILKKKGKKKTIKVVTSKEIKPLKNLNKQELTDKEYSKNDSHQSVDMDVETYDSNNYIGEDGGTKLEFFYSQNDHIVKFKDNSKNVEEDNMSLFKKKKKKKKGHKKILQNYENLKNDITTLEVEKLYIETCNDSDKHSNKVKTRDSYLNKDESTRRIPIANASEGDPLLKSPLKNTKKKKKKSKKYQTIKEDTESSKYEPIQINHINIEDLKKDIPEVQSDKIHNDPATMNTPYNSKILKKKGKKKTIKVVTSKEIKPLKNLNKQELTDKEYSKNDSHQSVDMDVETYDSNNYIGEDGGTKLEFFYSQDNHTSEYRTMTDPGMYFSQHCNPTSNNANVVDSHENVLTGNTPHQCDVCFKMFSFKCNLYIHKRTHTGEKPYACIVCGRLFSQQGSLVTHYRTHSGEKPYTCNVCGQSFSQKGNMFVHKRTHTGEKPYACNVCGRSFSQKGDLVRHNRIHTGERPFECDHCEKKFYACNARLRHVRRIHTKCL